MIQMLIFRRTVTAELLNTSTTKRTYSLKETGKQITQDEKKIFQLLNFDIFFYLFIQRSFQGY